MATNYEFLVSGRIDLTRVEQQLEQMRQRYSTLDITVNLTNLNGVEQHLRNMSQQLQQGTDVVLGRTTTHLTNTYQSINNLRRGLADMNFSGGSIGSITEGLERLDLSISRITTNINANGGITLNIRGLQDLNTAVTLTRTYDANGQLIEETNRRIVQSFDDGSRAARDFNTTLNQARNAFDSNKMSLNLQQLNSQYKALASTGHTDIPQLANGLQRLQEIHAQMGQSGISSNRFVELYREWIALLPQVQNGLKGVVQAQRDANKEQQTMSKSATLSNNIQTWLNKNTRAAKVYGNELRQIMNTLQNNKDPAALTNAQRRFEEIDSAAGAAGLKTAGLLTRIKNIAMMATGLWSTYQILMKCVAMAKKMVQATIDLDSAMGQLQIVTKATNAEMSAYYKNMSGIAQEIGASMTDLTKSTTTYARLGYSMEESEQLAKYTSMLKNVGDIDVEDTQNAMTALIKAYDLKVDDIETVMDKMVKVGEIYCPAT